MAANSGKGPSASLRLLASSSAKDGIADILAAAGADCSDTPSAGTHAVHAHCSGLNTASAPGSGNGHLGTTRSVGNFGWERYQDNACDEQPEGLGSSQHETVDRSHPRPVKLGVQGGHMSASPSSCGLHEERKAGTEVSGLTELGLNSVSPACSDGHTVSEHHRAVAGNGHHAPTSTNANNDDAYSSSGPEDLSDAESELGEEFGSAKQHGQSAKETGRNLAKERDRGRVHSINVHLEKLRAMLETEEEPLVLQPPTPSCVAGNHSACIRSQAKRKRSRSSVQSLSKCTTKVDILRGVYHRIVHLQKELAALQVPAGDAENLGAAGDQDEPSAATRTR